MTAPDTEPTIVALDSIAEWVDRYCQAKRDEKQAKETAAEARTVDDEPVIRWRPIESRRLDTDKLRKAYPDLVAEFTRPNVAWHMEIIGEDKP